MRFYRVTHYEGTEGSQGFSWHTSRKSATAARREFIEKHTSDAEAALDVPEIEEVEIQPTKAGILAALETYAAHPDNG